MAKLIIRNIGPLSEINIELKRLNVFIGPQSSGKSTIAKIISFCQWLEKDCVRRQKILHVDKDFTKKEFIDYHNISGYLRDSSYFSYNSDVLEIVYKDETLHLKRGKGFQSASVSKNAYIPSERNLISVPGIFQTKMPDNYILSFLTDWKQIRKEYSSSNPTEVIPTGDVYYYNEKDDKDMLRLKDGEPLALSQSSSGLQSITPLVVYVNYVADWIYSHPEMLSADNKEELWEAALANFIESSGDPNNAEKGLLDHMSESDTPKEVTEGFDTLLKWIRNTQAHGTVSGEKMIQEVAQVKERLSKPSFSNIVIEEPEQNLFPQTQRTLIEFLLAKHNSSRDSMVITTHSPFVLYSINNCMMAFMASVKENNGIIEEITGITPTAFTDPANVCVWELRDGHIENVDGKRNVTIQDEKGLIRDNYFDRVMNNVMCDFRNMLAFM